MSIDEKKIEEKWEEKLKTLSEEDKEDIEFIKKDWLHMEGARIIIPDSFDFIIKTIGIYSNFEIMKSVINNLNRLFLKHLNNIKEQKKDLQEQLLRFK